MPNSTPPSDLTRGTLFALGSAIILATTAVFIRYLTETYALPALVLAFWRDLFVLISMALILKVWRPSLMRVPTRQVKFLAVFGLALAIFNSLWTLAVSLTGAAVATVLAYTSAGFTALLGWWLLKERLDWARIVAVALSLGGCVLVAGALDPAAWSGNTPGILTGVLSGLLYAIYTLMGRAASQRGLNPWSTLLYTFGFAAVFLLGFNLLLGGLLPGAAAEPGELLWLGSALTGWGVLFLLAAGPTLAGFGLYNLSLVHLPSAVANLILTLEPAFTAAMAYAFLGERLTGVQIGGSLMVMAGVAFLRVHEGRLARRSGSLLVREVR